MSLCLFGFSEIMLFFFLQKTDITQPALEALAESRVRRVLIVGRRGPAQVACTVKVPGRFPLGSFHNTATHLIINVDAADLQSCHSVL